MAGKGIKVKEDAISEIVVADSNWELGPEGSDVEHYLEEEEKEEDEEKE